MHCGNCGSTSAEVRPCHIEGHRDSVLSGDVWLCRVCANQLFRLAFKGSSFVTWLGFPCDTCKKQAAFDGSVPGLPEGIVCDQCSRPCYGPDEPDDAGRGVWLCVDCYDTGHYGHRQKQLQPILERLSKII